MRKFALLVLVVVFGWSSVAPAASLIAFTSDRAGDYEIYTMGTDGSSLTKLTSNSAHEYEPTWSPDGSQIAFLSERDGNSEIYVMNADGSNQRNISNSDGDDSFPAWKP